jgi:hypothetical protein
MRVLSHDGVARVETVRTSVACGLSGCDWCGSKPKWLYRYGTRPDDTNRISWHVGDFCSKQCHNDYHDLH